MRYLHSSMFGSYYVPCSIEDVRPCKVEHTTQAEKDFGIPTTQYQFLILFFDENIGEWYDKWVDEHCVEEIE